MSTRFLHSKTATTRPLSIERASKTDLVTILVVYQQQYYNTNGRQQYKCNFGFIQQIKNHPSQNNFVIKSKLGQNVSQVRNSGVTNRSLSISVGIWFKETREEMEFVNNLSSKTYLALK